MLKLSIFTLVKTKKSKDDIKFLPITFQVRDVKISEEKGKWDLYLNQSTRISIFKSNYRSDVHSLYAMMLESISKRWTRDEMSITLTFPDVHRYQALPNVPCSAVVSIGGMQYHFKNDLSFIETKKEEIKNSFKPAVPRIYTKPETSKKFRANSTVLVDVIETNLDLYLSKVSKESVVEDTKEIIAMLKEIEKLWYSEQYSKYYPMQDFEVCFLRYVIDELSDNVFMSNDWERIHQAHKVLKSRVNSTVTAMKLVNGRKPLRVIWDRRIQTIDTQMAQRMMFLFYATLNFCVWYGYHISKEEAVSEALENMKYILNLGLEQKVLSTNVSQFLLYLETVLEASSLYGGRTVVDNAFSAIEKMVDYVTTIIRNISSITVEELENRLEYNRIS